MSNLVKTKEILAALDIDHPPLTMELMLEREAAIEERWLEQFREQEDAFQARAQAYDALITAQSKIGVAAQSELHNKRIPIPSLVDHSGGAFTPPTVVEDALTEVMDATVRYIAMGADFEVMMNAVKSNEMVKNQWDKFCVVLRMALP